MSKESRHGKGESKSDELLNCASQCVIKVCIFPPAVSSSIVCGFKASRRFSVRERIGML